MGGEVSVLPLGFGDFSLPFPSLLGFWFGFGYGFVYGCV